MSDSQLQSITSRPSRWRRIASEFGSFITFTSRPDISAFTGASDSELCLRLAAIRIYRRLDRPSVFFGTFLKANLAFISILVFYCTYHICSSPERLQSAWLGPVLLGASLPFVLTLTNLLLFVTAGCWLLEKPKRLRIMSDRLVLHMELSAELFAEIVIPWSSIEKIELKRLFRFTPEKEAHVVITTALGTNYSLRLDDMLVDNSQAAFLNAINTWAPHLVQGRHLLGFSALPKSNSAPSSVSNIQFTELWLHQFSTANLRQRDGLLPAGTTLKNGAYTIVGVIGGGGQGNAYLVATANGDQVLKEYIMPVYQGSSVLERLSGRLEQEAEILSKIDHAGVVKLFDCFVEDYRGYLALEYVDGRSLKELVQSEGRQQESVVVEIGLKLVDVLAYLHDFYPPVVHRDLTPDNIMISRDGVIKVVDFAVAKRLESASGATVVGKHAYIPPEQFRGKPCPQSDLYALGATLHFLLTAVDPEPLSQSHPRQFGEGESLNISENLDAVVARATSADLAQRFATASEMRQALEAVQLSLEISHI